MNKNYKVGIIIKNLETSDTIVGEYMIDEDDPIKINFLRDYSEFLLKSHLYDEKIINWQIENRESLMNLGFDMNVFKKVILHFV